ncbi:hypothetical protein [Rhodobacter sp. TJ_12]|uniref:hypothetical protein n=1 Tax=Rhodobacter sp. TJ_12 TaxID=2029399 RepID=UPI001CBC937D|nr:hypothetical protein [Rhodobacter sp. TJ_12]
MPNGTQSGIYRIKGTSKLPPENIFSSKSTDFLRDVISSDRGYADRSSNYVRAPATIKMSPLACAGSFLRPRHESRRHTTTKPNQTPYFIILYQEKPVRRSGNRCADRANARPDRRNLAQRTGAKLR